MTIIKPMKVQLIVNPTSGIDSAPDHLPIINDKLSAKFGHIYISMTTGSGSAEVAGARAAAENCSHIFVAGGDGTLNEVLNGVASVPGALHRVTFGLIPLGTGNDFARALGLPEDIDECLRILLEDFHVMVDLGKMNNRRFVNVSAGGFIAEVSDAVDPELKSIAGKLAYLIGGTQVLFDYEPVRTTLKISGGEMGVVEKTFDMQLFAVCNSRFVGGGRLIAPHAVMDDGLLDICIVEAAPALEFISLLSRIADGTHLEHERVYYTRGRRIELTFDRTIKVNTDGEVLEAARCIYTVEPREVRFLASKMLEE
jgi:diacylglycerol kinase (ATP)